MKSLLLAAFPLLLSALAAAQGQTWTVDDNGVGVDFTDIATAVAAVAPGDVLVVAAGSYGGFTLDKELTIVAENGAQTTSMTTITNLAAGARVVVSRLDFRGLRVIACDGPVVLDDLSVINFSQGNSNAAVRIEDSDDVRFNGCTVIAVLAFITQQGVEVRGSRVEFSSCYIQGGNAEDDDNGDYGYDGSCGVSAYLGSRVHVALTSVYGGDGGNACNGFCAGGYAGNGAPAISVGSGSTAIVAGRAVNTIEGGNRGSGNFPGTRASGIEVLTGGDLRWSGVTIKGGGPPLGAPPPIQLNGGTATQVIPADPTLAITGNSAAGGTVALTLYGVAGANGRLQQGGEPLVVDDELATIEKLANRIRLHPLGSIPGTGTIAYAMVVPTNWPVGRFRVFQGLEIDAASGMLIERTNSVPFVVH